VRWRSSRVRPRIADKWVDASRFTDDELADRIRADKIDILIDLSGHTAGNRLAVFARKPAPIAVSAWGSGGSGTGLRTIDYLFADPVSIPQDVRHLYAERVYDLPCVITLGAPPAELRTGEPPCIAKGYVTFGIFNRIEKISDNTTQVWSRILRAAPNSRLVIKHTALDDAALASLVAARFTAQGISADAIMCLGRTMRGEHLAAYGAVDICLDPFPHNGGVSTWEALHMGVPVVARLGNSSVGRAAAAIVSSIGLVDWIGEDDAAYVDVALKHASTPAYLSQLRRELPGRIANSASGNSALYTKAVEDAYRGFWKNYCDGVPARR
jgi:predicted O-linked N-acetylglucosamine transferase (SPINDLY family)